MLRRAYMRAAAVWKILPPTVLLGVGFGSMAALIWADETFSTTALFRSTLYVASMYVCVPTVTMSVAYGMIRRIIEVMLLRREMTGPVCPKCKSSLIGLRVESRGAEPDPAQNRVRCPECGVNWRMLDIGLTPRDLMPHDWNIEGAGTRPPHRGE